jgi:hypothetical protein
MCIFLKVQLLHEAQFAVHCVVSFEQLDRCGELLLFLLQLCVSATPLVSPRLAKDYFVFLLNCAEILSLLYASHPPSSLLSVHLF